MNLIEIWKNRETKRKLREENIRLREENKCLKNIPYSSVCTVERNVQRIQASIDVSLEELEYMPTEAIKKEIACNIMEHLIHFIEYSFEDVKREKRCIGTLYVATKSKRIG